jgi:hypothetical protein
MNAILRGGPVDGRIIDDVPESTESMNIPASRTLDPKYAHYVRAGSEGPYLRFDFVAVYTALERPII